ncbi:ATPase [Brevirhabdus sp.]|uniref:ATPase n=1 Tax=Brevirhabdus sp. TaxID=2004514 RepID=UPI00405A3070
MIYDTARDWTASRTKRVLLFGMSGLGKTHVSAMLRAAGNWFHYSIDYRIGTRYMGEHIVDNFKAEAMKTPFLAHLLRTDSIYIASNITFENLAPLSSYLGKPGNPDLGGLPFEEYMHRQDQHRRAEIAALLDTPHFIDRARRLYGYDNFICDTGGSICEVADPDDPEDEVLSTLSAHLLFVWIEGSEAHTEELARRFDRAPKPMYYDPAFLRDMWARYLAQSGRTEAEVDPDAFVRWAYREAMAHRQPKYRAMAEKWGLTVSAGDVAALTSPEDFEALIARRLEDRRAGA